MSKHAIVSVDDAERAAFELKRCRPRDPSDPRSAGFLSVSNALYALANDTNFIVTDASVVPQQRTTKHYFCHSTDGNGDSLDWFIEAASPEEAMKLWGAAVSNAGLEFDDTEPTHMWEIPALIGHSTAVYWNSDSPQPHLTPVGQDLNIQDHL